jgi:hypothetical protein
MSLLLLYPFTRAWIAIRRDRWTEAGAWMGGCVSLKLFFLVFVAWFAARGAWRAILAAGGSLAAIVAAGSLAFGTRVYGDWIQGLSRIGWWWLPMNASLRGLVERVVVGGKGLAPVMRSPGIGKPLWLLLASAVVVATAWRTGPWAKGADCDRTVLLLLLAALLLSPLGWVYYLPLATGPVLAMVRSRRLLEPGFSRVAILIGLSLLYLPMEIAESQQPSALATLTLASTYSWGVLAVWSGLIAAPHPQERVTA